MQTAFISNIVPCSYQQTTAFSSPSSPFFCARLVTCRFPLHASRLPSTITPAHALAKLSNTPHNNNQESTSSTTSSSANKNTEFDKSPLNALRVPAEACSSSTQQQQPQLLTDQEIQQQVNMIKAQGSSSTPTAQEVMDAMEKVEQRLRQEYAAKGSDFDALFNGKKVVQLEYEIGLLQAAIERLDENTPNREQLEAQYLKDIATRQAKADFEKRSFMRQWLRNVFQGQAIVFGLLGGLMAADQVPFYQHVPLVVQALGFWMIWLFTIPSLRSKKPLVRKEKKALDVAFLATPLMNIILPAFLKDTFVLWAADVTLLLSAYAYYYLIASEDKKAAPAGPFKVKGILKWLDWGSWR